MARKIPARWKQDLSDLVDWLQRAEGKDPLYPFIAKMVSCLNELDDAFRKGRQIGEELRDVVAINGELRNLQLVPDLQIDPGVPCWFVGYQGKDGASILVAKVLYLAQRGLLRRVRRCAYSECNRWFLATPRMRDFHVPYCREKKYLSTPEGKEVRARGERDRRKKASDAAKKTLGGRTVTTLGLRRSPRKKVKEEVNHAEAKSS